MSNPNLSISQAVLLHPDRGLDHLALTTSHGEVLRVPFQPGSSHLPPRLQVEPEEGEEMILFLPGQLHLPRQCVMAVGARRLCRNVLEPWPAVAAVGVVRLQA